MTPIIAKLLRNDSAPGVLSMVRGIRSVAPPARNVRRKKAIHTMKKIIIALATASALLVAAPVMAGPVSGAVIGAGTGAVVAGPPGAVVGGVIGAVVGGPNFYHHHRIHHDGNRRYYNNGGERHYY
jgi:uncharacterized protein YcfJ